MAIVADEKTQSRHALPSYHFALLSFLCVHTNPNPLSFIPQVAPYRKRGISRPIFLTLGNI